MGELYKPGFKLGRDLATLVPAEEVIERILANRRIYENKIILKCKLCGKVFTDPMDALLHQYEHWRRNEDACFIIELPGITRYE